MAHTQMPALGFYPYNLIGDCVWTVQLSWNEQKDINSTMYRKVRQSSKNEVDKSTKTEKKKKKKKVLSVYYNEFSEKLINCIAIAIAICILGVKRLI